MGTNLAGSWQKVVKLLQECSTRQTGSTGTEAVIRSVQDLIDKMQHLPAPPKAVWKKLVQQLQVCCALCHTGPQG
jgi:hypothetical protein